VTLLLAEHRAAGSSDPRFPWAGWHQDTVFPGQTPSELGAAYRNRTDDLRITRRIQAVHRSPPGHSSPAREGARSSRVQGRPGSLLASPLARTAGGSALLHPPRAGSARQSRSQARAVAQAGGPHPPPLLSSSLGTSLPCLTDWRAAGQPPSSVVRECPPSSGSASPSGAHSF
jgi:hypothetical protein